MEYHLSSFYDLNNLKLIWSVQIGGANVPIVSGNSLFLIDNRNILYAMNAKNGKIKWMKQLDINIEEGFYFKDVKKINFIGPFLIDNKLIIHFCIFDIFACGHFGMLT